MSEITDPNQDYVRIVSHQLKSPIAAIESLLKTITEGYAGEVDEKTAFILEKAINRSSEAREIISDLTAYELYSEPGSLEKSDFDLSELCAALASRYHPIATENNKIFRTEFSTTTSIFVRGDRRGIEHAIRNLIENAIKYTPEHGAILLKLTIASDKKHCYVQVGDTGSGIPEDELEQIFNPFYRSITHKASIQGTGLGLPIVKRITESHGGEVTVTSLLNKGSEFTMTLPLQRMEILDSDTINRKKVVIIGGVTAGPKTAARLRRLDENLEITIVEKGRFLSYSGCGLPGYISGRVDSPRELMTTGDSTVRDIEFFESIDNIRILNNSTATDINRENQYVEVEERQSGQISRLPYDTLVLATGAIPVIPDIPGIGNDRIFTLRSLEDAEAIKSVLTSGRARDLFFIGGGLIGISAAEELLEAGARITILEKKEYILLKLMDRDVADRIQNELSKKGIKILTDINIQQIDEMKDSLRIRTNRGSYDADMIIISTGVSPNVDLAQKAGLKIGDSGGIKVSGTLQTSDEQIYAVGDCAESVHLITGQHEYWPLGSVSTKMGRIAANNISGKHTEFLGSIGTTMFKMRDLNVSRTGLTTRSAWKHGFEVESVVVTGKDRAHPEDDTDAITLKVIADKTTRRILGAQGYGTGNVMGKIETFVFAISHSLTLEEVFATDLGYAPSFNNPIDLAQTACLSLTNKIENLVHTISPDEFEKVKEGVRIVSVCPASSYASQNIPGSINIPLERLRFDRLPFDQNSHIILYSRTSAGAYVAYRYLSSQGYANLSVLEGGFLFWQK